LQRKPDSRRERHKHREVGKRGEQSKPDAVAAGKQLHEDEDGDGGKERDAEPPASVEKAEGKCCELAWLGAKALVVGLEMQQQRGHAAEHDQRDAEGSRRCCGQSPPVAKRAPREQAIDHDPPFAPARLTTGT
jgi:hypothetical protein